MVDEDLSRSLSRLLNLHGYLAEDVRDINLKATPDIVIFRHAVQHGKTLISGDMGFSNVFTFPLGSHSGILVSRVPDTMPIKLINQVILDALNQLQAEDIRGNLVIIEPTRIRIRRFIDQKQG